MNKEIKEMAEVMRKQLTISVGSCRSDDIPLDDESAKIVEFYSGDLAVALYNAGYRKQSDTIKELEKKHTDILKEIIQNRLDYHCDKTKYRYELGKACVEFFISDIIKDLINDLKKEYGVG